MFATDDTIVAISTPPGRAGIGVVRVSGPEAQEIVQRLTGRSAFEARRATFTTIAATPGGAARTDQVVVTSFPAPHSYTGDHVVEVSAHGSPVILQQILQAAVTAGARLAAPGEFTLRAFLNGKLDLIQAEAVADLIEAATPLQARAAFDQLEGTLTDRIAEIDRGLFDLIARLEASLDFPDEGYHFAHRDAVAMEIASLSGRITELLATAACGRMIREGAQIAIVGTPNVGKSSLFNAILNADRAIVTPIPGTTRDLVTERADVRGIAVSLVDTAGIRESVDPVEQEGISRARHAASVADLTILVLDQSRPLSEDDWRLMAQPDSAPRVVVVNKIDLARAWPVDSIAQPPVVLPVSLKTGEGFGAFLDGIAALLGVREPLRDEPLVSNVRHVEMLRQCDAALQRAATALRESCGTISEEFILADLQEAAASLEEITGKRTTDDLLARIFERFCIGK